MDDGLGLALFVVLVISIVLFMVADITGDNKTKEKIKALEEKVEKLEATVSAPTKEERLKQLRKEIKDLEGE